MWANIIDHAFFSTGKIHETFGGHGYMFTWEEPKTVGLQLSWAEAREFCRARCMDLASLETMEENDFIKERVAKGNTFQLLETIQGVFSFLY